MPIVKGISLLQQIKDAQPHWFSPENKRFFGDIAYYGLYGKKSGLPYLVQYTNAWTDMFGGSRRMHWRINPLDDNLKIRPLVPTEFRDLDAVKEWLGDN